MPWPGFWPFKSAAASSQAVSSNTSTSAIANQVQEATSTATDRVKSLKSELPNNSSELISSLTSPATLLSTAILTTAILTLTLTYRRFLRRIPTATHIPESYIQPSARKFTRSLFGPVTTVTDADNFRLFHTPLGRLALWGLVRRVPTTPSQLKDNTIHIRLAGIDAPELSHFGRPAQPYSKEALQWLTSYLRGRRVRCYCRRKDQYGRVVATVYVRRGLIRRDVSLEMLKVGLAGVYEAKTGVEFGGQHVEKRYRRAEQLAQKKRRGMWASTNLESPREYKNRYRDGGGGVESDTAGGQSL